MCSQEYAVQERDLTALLAGMESNWYAEKAWSFVSLGWMGFGSRERRNIVWPEHF